MNEIKILSDSVMQGFCRRTCTDWDLGWAMNHLQTKKNNKDKSPYIKQALKYVEDELVYRANRPEQYNLAEFQQGFMSKVIRNQPRKKVLAIIKYNKDDMKQVAYARIGKAFVKIKTPKVIEKLSYTNPTQLTQFWSTKETAFVYEDEQLEFEGRAIGLSLEPFTISDKVAEKFSL
jgi:hypothetical protein